MSRKVLLIDDCAPIHRLLQTWLKKEDLEVYGAMSAEEGLKKAVDVNPDLILLDVEMPGMNGMDLCRKLKGDPQTMGIPIIFLTGADSVDEKINGLDAGAADYVTKPCNPAELSARVRATLRTKYLMDLLSKKAMIDGLTGLWNRAMLDKRLVGELGLSQRSGRPLACMMADVDHFKSINDRFGHPFGDKVLTEVANVMNGAVRGEDVVCRYGGEEFAILAPNTSAADLASVAERVRKGVEELQLNHRGKAVSVACSVGVSDMQLSGSRGLIESADHALYQAKQRGRNRVELATLVADVAVA